MNIINITHNFKSIQHSKSLNTALPKKNNTGQRTFRMRSNELFDGARLVPDGI
jgi:hypothetical protein